MNSKSLLTGTLLFFVCGSLIFLIYKETRSKPATTAAVTSTTVASNTPVPQPSTEAVLPATAPANIASSTQEAQPHKVTAYYFHGNFRCTTCQNIEKYSREAIFSAFKDVLDSGELEWRVINVEEPGNEHFNEDYKLVTKSLILSESVDGREVRWTNLEKIWQLVGEPESFKQYVRNEVRGYLDTL